MDNYTTSIISDRNNEYNMERTEEDDHNRRRTREERRERSETRRREETELKKKEYVCYGINIMNIKIKKKLRKEEIKRILEAYHIDITIKECIKTVKRSKGIKKENIEYINKKVDDMTKEEDNIENGKIREIIRKKEGRD
ncbi:hypothetical protein, conserved [Entamoeba histolytica]